MPNTRSVVKPVTQTVSKRVDSFVPRIAQRLTGDDGCIAYSLRDIGANGGPVVNVRRNHDNATRDFTAAEIAAGHVLSWGQEGQPGGTILQVHVSRWYDQGNSTWKRDAVQTNVARQPYIVLNDVFQSDGILFGNAKWLDVSTNPDTNLNWSQPITNFLLSKVVSQSGFAGPYWGTTEPNFETFFFESPDATFNFTANSSFTTANCLSNDSLLGSNGLNVKSQTTVISDATSVLRLNGTQVDSGSFGTNGLAQNIHIGTVSNFQLSGTCNIPEIYFFNSKPSDKFITELENNQKNYYGI